MKNLGIALSLVCALMSCTNQKAETTRSMNTASSEEIPYEQVFKEVKGLLQPKKTFWKKQLYGPILLIDPETRVFTANRNNARGSFKKVGNVYTDTLPEPITIANTAISWEGEKWTMVMTPLPADTDSRNNLIIHELFHRVQDTLGFNNMAEAANGHLDTYKGRLLLRLELQALKQALTAEDRTTGRIHLENALYFRHYRQDSFGAFQSENALEINEGLAEYTGAMLSGRKDEALVKHLLANIDAFYTNKTFVRSFAYQTIPVYGYLLSQETPHWQWDIDKETHLTNYLFRAFDIKPSLDRDPVDVAMANDYGYEAIATAEMEREHKRLALIKAYKKKFLEDPVLTLHFRNMNISFDPRNITPLEDQGTVYPNLKVTDDWGMLTVANGALLSADWSSVTVTVPTKVTAKIVEGDGWKLELHPEWEVQGKQDQYTLEKK